MKKLFNSKENDNFEMEIDLNLDDDEELLENQLPFQTKQSNVLFRR